jgi:hypothetical protein
MRQGVGGGDVLAGRLRSLKLTEEEKRGVRGAVEVRGEGGGATAVGCGQALLGEARQCGRYGADFGENLVPGERN